MMPKTQTFLKPSKSLDREMSEKVGLITIDSLTWKKLNRKVVAMLTLLIIVGIVLVSVVSNDRRKERNVVRKIRAKRFQKAAVAADSLICSKVGTQILRDGGSAVDAAVATQFCNGVVDIQSSGIGGGGFLLVYNRKQNKAEVFDYREVAPGRMTIDVFKSSNISSMFGGMSIAVPGEAMGLRKAWEKYGQLPWKRLLDPAIKLAREGFPLQKSTEDAFTKDEQKLRRRPRLMKLLSRNGRFLKSGEILKRPKYAATLERLQDHPYDMYEGELAKQIVEDISAANGIITLQDLMSYSVKVRAPIVNKFGNLTMLSTPPPGCGCVLAMILNIIAGFDLKPTDVDNDEGQVLMHHKMVEAFKWAYARRALLGDPDFVDKEKQRKVIDQMLNHSIADAICRNKISLKRTYNITYYGGFFGEDDFGTTHVSVLAENGDAAASTNTINLRFGSYVLSEKTGIIFNDEIKDFSIPGRKTKYGFPVSPFNYIFPGKRPLSSKSPTVIIDEKGDVKLVIGASGGTMIITALAQVMIETLFLGKELGMAIESPRVHHQLLPNNITLDPSRPISEKLHNGLEKLGHEVGFRDHFAVVQAIFKPQPGEIYAKSDPRKHGEASGY